MGEHRGESTMNSSKNSHKNTKNSHKNTKQGQKIGQSLTETQKNSKALKRVQIYELEDLRWLRCYEPFGPV